MQVTRQLIFSFLTLCSSITFIVLANMLVLIMVGEINRKKRDSEQISYLGFTFVKGIKVITEYRRLYPSGTLHIFMIAFLAGAMCLLLVFAWQLGFF